MQPSSLFIAPAEPEVPAADEEGEDKEPVEVLDLDWHSKLGMAHNIQLVKKEFEKARGLKPVKVFITGPPCAGKSFFGQQLGEHYNIPHIHMEKMLEDLLCWDQEKEDNHLKIVSEKQRLTAEVEKQRQEELKERQRKLEE